MTVIMAIRIMTMIVTGVIIIGVDHVCLNSHKIDTEIRVGLATDDSTLFPFLSTH